LSRLLGGRLLGERHAVGRPVVAPELLLLLGFGHLVGVVVVHGVVLAHHLIGVGAGAGRAGLALPLAAPHVGAGRACGRPPLQPARHGRRGGARGRLQATTGPCWNRTHNIKKKA